MLGDEGPTTLASAVDGEDPTAGKYRQAHLAEAFVRMMRRLHAASDGATLRLSLLGDEEMRGFISAHADILDSAVRTVPMSDAMRSRLAESNYIFSGIKTFHELNEAFPALVGDDGRPKPFRQFLNDVRAVDETYNRQYLLAEYDLARKAAEAAAGWERIAEDGDRYDLQYRTMKDSLVRPEHAALDGITLPPDDPFWRTYYPPNGWRCRCHVQQVRRGKYERTDPEEAHRRGEEALAHDRRGIFRFNPGIERKTFPDYNPYTIRRCRDCDRARDASSAVLAFVPESDLCAACQIIRSSRDGRRLRLTAAEFKMAAERARQWADRNLGHTEVRGHAARRTYIRTADGHSIEVGKKFFDETAAKNKRNPDLIHVMKTATEFAAWLHKATCVRVEEGRHHNCKFSVYLAEYQGQTIECKCKKHEDGEVLYTMRVI